MTVSYVSNGIDGSQCAYQCLTADKKNVFSPSKWLETFTRIKHKLESF